MVENGGRKGRRQGIDGLCIVAKTNAWKTVKCESIERKRWRNVSEFFGESSAEICGWMGGVRNALKNVSDLNNRVKERAYQESW